MERKERFVHFYIVQNNKELGEPTTEEKCKWIFKKYIWKYYRIKAKVEVYKNKLQKDAKSQEVNKIRPYGEIVDTKKNREYLK